MTVVVTGASGHLGGTLVRELLALGRRVRCVYQGDGRALEGLDTENIQADIRDGEAMKKAFQGAETLFHLAALISIDGGHGGKVRSINVDGVRSVMEAALQTGIGRVVHCSSIHAFDLSKQSQPISEETKRSEPQRQGVYDCSKADGENEVRAAIQRGLPAVIVNPTGVIGPFDFKPSRMGSLFLKLYHRTLPSLVEGGFNFVDVRDVIHSMIAAETKGVIGQKYILSGHWESMRSIATMAEATTGIKAPRFSSPMFLARFAAPFAVAFARLAKTEPLFTPESLHALRSNRLINNQKAVETLQHNARPLQASIEDIYAWFEKAGMLGKKAR